jgi:polysaccharide export outer membrane protein
MRPPLLTYAARAVVAGGLVLPLLCLGCQKTRPASTAENMRAMAEQVVVISPGDEVEVKFFYNPELNELQRVRPDGKITLQLLGDIDAAGKQPAELKYVLSRLAEMLLENPEVAVFVRSQVHRFVYVGGAVNNPRSIEIPGRLEALAAIMAAGGFDRRTAYIGNVVVIRHKSGKRYGCALDFRPVLEGQESEPFFLEPEDIVYVPQTPIANVNRWIDQHVNKIIPQLGIIYSRQIGNDSTLAIDTSRDFYF